MRDNKASGSRKGKAEGNSSRSYMELNGEKLSFRSILKEVELLGSSDMTWKERKDLQNKKIVSMGGKTVKQQRLPLSVAKKVMKNQKAREQKALQQELLCGRSDMVVTSARKPKQPAEKRRPEDKVLKSSEGRFRNGVLDVKHLLKSAAPPRGDDRGGPMAGKGRKKKQGGKKNHGKRKGSGKKRH